MAGGLRPQAYVHNPMEWVDPLGLAGCPKAKSARGVPGIDQPFRAPHPDYPTNSAVVDAMADARTRLRDGIDCSEIADDLHAAAGGEGQVIVFRSSDAPWPAPAVEDMKPRFNPPFRDSTTFQYPQQDLNGSILPVRESYHAVYSDGRYVYDGALHNDGIPIGDYTKLVDSMNPNGVGYRLYNPDAGELLKGSINGK